MWIRANLERQINADTLPKYLRLLPTRKPRKIYCIDNRLRNAASFKFLSDEGKLAENSTLVELKRRNLDAYYWKDRKEVDFIVRNRDNTLTGINVTSKSMVF